MISPPSPARRLTLFNHKGGVGKTTLTVNLACALADAGKQVLLVDTDPQCNLSSFFLEESRLDKMLDESDSGGGQTLWSALKPVAEGTGQFRQIDAIKVRDGIHLAVGDLALTAFEESLSDCWTLCLKRDRRGYLCTAALSQVVTNLANRTGADYVLFDSGPNIGALNRVILLDCHWFIVPAACDLFSARALKTLGFALSDWVQTWQRIQEMAPDSAPLLSGVPQLMGYIPQGFRIYRGEPAESNLQVLSTIDQRIVKFVWAPLRQAYDLPTSLPPKDLQLAQVKFFGVLVTEAQKLGCSLWDVPGGNQGNKDAARQLFSALAKRVIASSR